MIATVEVPGSLGSSCTLTYISAKIAPTPHWSRASSGSPDSSRPGTASSTVFFSSSPSSSSSDDSSEAQPFQVVPFGNVATKQGGTKRRKLSAGSSNGSTSDGDEVLLVGYGVGGTRTRNGPSASKRFRSDAHLSDYLISEGKDVDDHFKKSLGEDYDAVFEEDTVKKSVFNGLRQKYAVKPRDVSPPAQSDPNSVVICEEEVEDHFLKALGTTWESIQSGRRSSDDPSDASV